MPLSKWFLGNLNICEVKAMSEMYFLLKQSNGFFLSTVYIINPCLYSQIVFNGIVTENEREREERESVRERERRE